jgi:hypothetical protein
VNWRISRKAGSSKSTKFWLTKRGYGNRRIKFRLRPEINRKDRDSLNKWRKEKWRRRIFIKIRDKSWRRSCWKINLWICKLKFSHLAHYNGIQQTCCRKVFVHYSSKKHLACLGLNWITQKWFWFSWVIIHNQSSRRAKES